MLTRFHTWTSRKIPPSQSTWRTSLVDCEILAALLIDFISRISSGNSIEIASNFAGLKFRVDIVKPIHFAISRLFFGKVICCVKFEPFGKLPHHKFSPIGKQWSNCWKASSMLGGDDPPRTGAHNYPLRSVGFGI